MMVTSMVTILSTNGNARVQEDDMTESTYPAALVERLYEAMNTGDPKLVDDVATNVLAADWANDPLAPGQTKGADGFRSFVPWLRGVWPDLTISHDELVVSADGSTVP